MPEAAIPDGRRSPPAGLNDELVKGEHPGIEQAWERGPVTLSVRASVGVAIYPEDGASASTLLEAADRAMYTAKRERKGSERSIRIAPR